MTRTSVRRFLAPLLGLALLAGACDTPTPQASEGPFKKGSGTLRVLAGSELHDLQPILDDVKAATGVTVKLTEIGTLDGIERVASGAAVRDQDAIWFSNNRYLELHPQASGRIDVSTKVVIPQVVSMAVA